MDRNVVRFRYTWTNKLLIEESERKEELVELAIERALVYKRIEWIATIFSVYKDSKFEPGATTFGGWFLFNKGGHKVKTN